MTQAAPDLDRILTPQTLVLSYAHRQKLRELADRQGQNVSELARKILDDFFTRSG